MATIEQTVAIIFNAVDNTGGTLSTIGKNINTAVDKISNVTQPLSNIADKVIKTETSIIALGAAFLALSVNEAAKFKDQISEIGALVNAQPGDVDALRLTIRDLVAQTGTANFDQFASAFYTATSNIGDTTKALDIFDAAQKGAVVGATSLDNTIALVTRTMNAYGMVTDDSATNSANAERIMAAMFATVQAGDTNMQLLAENLGRVSSSAAAAEVPIEKVGAAIAAITGAGVNTAETMTLFNSLLKELLNPSEKLAAAFGGMSIQSDGLQAMMAKLKAETGGSADAMYQLFGSTEAAKAAIILANDSAGKFSGTLEAMKDATESFNDNYGKMADTVAFTSQKLANTFKGLLQEIGEPLLDSWNDKLKNLQNITNTFKLNVRDGAFDDLIGAFVGFEDRINQTLAAIAENLDDALDLVDFKDLIRSFEDLGLSIGGLFDGFDVSTPQGLANAIQLVVDSVTSLTDVTSGIVASWGPAVKTLLEMVAGFNDMDDSAKKATGNVLGIAQQFEAFKGILTGLSGGLDLVGTSLSVLAGVKVSESLISFFTFISGGSVAKGSATLGLLAANVVALKFAWDENSQALDEYNERQKNHKNAVDSAMESQRDLAVKLTEIRGVTGELIVSVDDFDDALARINASTGLNISGLLELKDAIDKGAITFNEATGQWERATVAARDFDAEVEAASQSSWDFAAEVNAVAANLTNFEKSADTAARGFGSLEEAQRYAATAMTHSNNVTYELVDGLWRVSDGMTGIVDSTRDAGQAVEDTAKSMERGSAEWERVQRVMLDTQRVANEFSIEMSELALKQYEIDVRANVDLNAAQIVAETQRIQAAFAATTETIGYLTDGATNLWGLFSDKAGFVGGKELEEAALRMEQRLDEELDLKRQMTEAMVAQAQATAERLWSGEPLINVDGGELQPELELIFDKILKFTQVKASQEGLGMLLGI